MSPSRSRKASAPQPSHGMKQTTTGSKLKINDVGSPLLHKHHDVNVEDAGNGWARAKIKDQLFIDKLLMNDDLTIAQHLEGERLIDLAQSANVYLKSPSMGVASFGGGKPDMMSSGLMRYARYFRRVIRKWGAEGAGILHDHVIEDKHTEDKNRIKLIAEMLTRK